MGIFSEMGQSRVSVGEDNDMEKAELIGTWKLVSCAGHLADGSIIYPFGKNPVGRLSYDAAGHFEGQMMNPDRVRFAGNDKSQGTDAELGSAIAGYEAYFGTYRVREGEDVVVHRVEGALFPNWVGGTQERFFRIEGRMLELKTGKIAYIGTTLIVTVMWERIV
jgi:hypothetical protein